MNPAKPSLEQFAAREAQCAPALRGCGHSAHLLTATRGEHRCLVCGRVYITTDAYDLSFAPGPGPAVSVERIEPGEGESL